MIVYDDGERCVVLEKVFYLTFLMNYYKRDPNNDENKNNLKRFIASFINIIKDSDQYLLNLAFDRLSYKPEQRYNVGDIKKLYDTL